MPDKRPIWQSIILVSNDEWARAHKQFEDIVHLAKTEVNLIVTPIALNVDNIESKIMNKAEIVMVSSEHDYLPYDVLINARTRFNNASSIGCFKPMPYPSPANKGRKRGTKQESPSVSFTKTEGGYLYPKFKPSFIPKKKLFNLTLCENEPIILTQDLIRKLRAEETRPSSRHVPLQFKQVATVAEYLMMEKHLTPSFRQIRPPPYFIPGKQPPLTTTIKLLYTPQHRVCLNNSIVLLVKSSR